MKEFKDMTVEELMEEVKKAGLNLQYVKEQIPEICLAAVKQNGHALQYVKEQTSQLCQEAIKQNCSSFQFVNSEIKQSWLDLISETPIESFPLLRMLFNSEKVSAIKYDSMHDLVVMYQATPQIQQIQTLLTGTAYALGYYDGVFGIFTRIFDIIHRECDQSLVNKELELEDNAFYKILVSDMTVDQKVDILLGK